MAIGGSLTVVNASSSEKFKVKVQENMVISNFLDKSPNKKGDTYAKVQDGKSYIQQQYSNVLSNNLSSFDIKSKPYTIFNELRGLDGDESNLTAADLAKAEQLIGSNGVKSISRDTKSGTTTILCSDGVVLKFDIETKTEMQNRKAEEAKTTEKNKIKQEEAKRQTANEKEEFHENCKSAWTKFGEFCADKLKKLWNYITE